MKAGVRTCVAVAVFMLGVSASAQGPPQRATAAFVGSKACEACHKSMYDRWKNTRMANVIVDAKQHPEAIVGDFSKPSDLVKFKKEDIAFTYGSKWKQRYFTKVGDDYFVFPAQWDVTRKVWRAYYVQPGTDWWVAHYPADQMKRPTGPLCDGCHSTNYDIRTKQVTEWNVGCEKCHGPGSDHARAPSKNNIVNPARLDFVRAADVCIQCHSQGQPLQKPLDGVYYDWPVGYLPGARLSSYWKLEEQKAGETTFTHFSEGSAHKNRMQGNDFVNSVMYTRGVRCWSCHDVHGTANSADVIKEGNDLCLTCHTPESPPGPHQTLEQHTHHAAASSGSQCTACHMPKIAQTIADVYVRSHTFRFITPVQTDKYKIPNACTSCHSERTTQWATQQLTQWDNFSPWRVSQ